VTVEYEGQTITVPVEPRAGLEGAQLTLGIRPEHTGLETADLNVTVAPSVIERLGVNTIAYGVAPTGENYCALLSGSAPVVVDEPIVTGIKASDCHLFDESGIALERRVDLSVLKLIQ
jgi:multiple sugar transport system ATP-binding protein